MGSGVEGSPLYNAHYLACTGGPARSGHNQNNMPVAFSGWRAPWLRPQVEFKMGGEEKKEEEEDEEKVNAEGGSGARVDRDTAQRMAAVSAAAAVIYKDKLCLDSMQMSR